MLPDSILMIKKAMEILPCFQFDGIAKNASETAGQPVAQPILIARSPYTMHLQVTTCIDDPDAFSPIAEPDAFSPNAETA